MIILKIIFTFIYFLIITPVGLFFKIVGIDFLKLKNQSNKSTYWIKRN